MRMTHGPCTCGGCTGMHRRPACYLRMAPCYELHMPQLIYNSSNLFTPYACMAYITLVITRKQGKLHARQSCSRSVSCCYKCCSKFEHWSSSSKSRATCIRMNAVCYLPCLRFCATLFVYCLSPSAAEYMALPASQYSVLDGRRIERVDEDTFRQAPCMARKASIILASMAGM